MTRLPLLLALLTLGLTSCEEYDAPPEVIFAQPEGGAFLQGEVIHLKFTEAIDPDTLAISVWPTERGTSRVPLATSVQPLLTSCQANSNNCEGIQLTIDKSGESAELLIEGELSMPGKPLILEIHDGLADAQGNQTGVSRFFDFQYRAANCGEATDLEFDDGIYILSATVDKPMTAVLTLVSHIVTLPDGKFALAGAKGKPIGDAPKNERDPAKIAVADDDTGFALFTKGCVSKQLDGRRLLETEPVDVELPVLIFTLRLTNVRIFADIKTHPETGKDRIEGILSYEALELVNGSKTTAYEGASTAVIADYVPEAPVDLRPAGHPVLCENLCGAIIGFCHPPEDFPGENFCP